MTNLTSEDIDAVCTLVNDLCGICWDESKSYLIEARLSTLVEQFDCENYQDLARKVRAELVPGLKEQVVDAVTTNETLWFRDESPFEALRHKVIPELIDDKGKSAFSKRFRVWSAACSTGQEPYSIAMAFADTISDIESWDIQILGTDISPSAVAQASRGVYNHREIGRGMDSSHLKKHFVARGEDSQVNEQIRSMCRFEQRNLHDPMTAMGPFDIIFCRNVAIYFTPEDQKRLFNNLAGVLAPNGWIFVGSSESLSNLGPEWKAQQHCRSNCYRPKMTAPATV
ncbi:MAG: protein-glutamate O-methyltransferase CheR [Planctomycetes bacterium]|nr:protein-glutamate O-methyltransferase CheR [Planctomycetota bacterium]